MPDDHDNAVETRSVYAAHHAETSLAHLLTCLGIERPSPGWQTQLAPFAPVWAAMIAAGAAARAAVAAKERTGAAPLRMIGSAGLRPFLASNPGQRRGPVQLR
jgi:hypothetical protein